jgi:hypothetical protein
MHDDLLHDAAAFMIHLCLAARHTMGACLVAAWMRRSCSFAIAARRNAYLFKVTHYRGKQAEPTVFTPQTSRSISHYKLGGAECAYIPPPMLSCHLINAQRNRNKNKSITLRGLFAQNWFTYSHISEYRDLLALLYLKVERANNFRLDLLQVNPYIYAENKIVLKVLRWKLVESNYSSTLNWVAKCMFIEVNGAYSAPGNNIYLHN